MSTQLSSAQAEPASAATLDRLAISPVLATRARIMIEVKLQDAGGHLEQLIEEAAAGEEVVITSG